ncbi:hypothetical protein LRP88_13019 [Fusarium phalaenopsidis]
MDTDDDGEEHIVPASHEDEVRKLRNKYNHLSIQHNNLLDGARNNARITQERLASMEASMNDMQERFRQAMEQQQQQYQQTINEQQNRIDRLTTLQAQQNDLAQQQVHDLGNLTFEHTAAGTTHKDIGEIIKPKDPEPFNGQATHVRTFLTSLRAYQRYFPTRMASAESKVLHASRCLTGNALTWFEPKLRDFLGNEPTEETQLLFAEYENFEEAIRRNFGTIDEEQQATQKLKNLRQTKAASTYAAEFTQITSFLNWGTSALQIAFYEGLKDEVKDELCKTEKPDNLQDYIDMTIKIDNRQFERRMEKSNKGRIWGNKNNANQSRRREQTRATPPTGPTQDLWNLEQPRRTARTLNVTTATRRDTRQMNAERSSGIRRRDAINQGHDNPSQKVRNRTLGMARQGYDKTGIQPDELDMPHSQVYLSEKQAEGNYMINNITKERLHEPVKPQKNNRSHITEHVGWKPLPEPNKGRQQPGNLMSQRTIAVTRRAEPKIEEPTTPPSAQQPSNEQADFQEAAAEGFDHKKWIVGYEEKEQLLVPATVHRRDCRQDDPTRCNHTLCPRHQIEASREYDEICERQKTDQHSRLPRNDWIAKTSSSNINRTKFEHKARQLQRELRQERSRKPRKSDKELWEEEDYPQLYDENNNRYWNSLRERYIQTAREHVETSDEQEICIRAYHRELAENPRHPEAPFNPRDDVRTYPTHQEHASISWMSCQHHWCETHREEKQEQDCFPVPLPHQPNHKPYLWYETEGYKVVHWYESIGVANARYSSKLYHATQEKKRITHKIEDWQKTISQENEEDPGAEQERQYQDWLHKKDDTHDYDACANSELDSGAEQNYFDPTTANRLRLPWRYKQTPYSVVNLEGTPFDYNNGIIDSEIDHLKVFVEGKNQGISFDVVPNKQHDLVLGYPWLQRFNPHFDWKTGQVLSFNDETPSTANDDSEYDTRSQTSTEGTGEARQRPTRDTSPPTGTRHKHQKGRKRQRQRMIARVMQQFHELEKDLAPQKKPQDNPEEEERLKNIPWQYRIYKKLFAEELETGLPEHTHYDLEIEFIDGKQPGFSKLYPLNEAQLPVLKEYIEDMIRKGYIRESKSSVGYPVMFVPKKNGKLRLCVDFRMLNAITVKDRTPLPLISELKDRLFGMKYFTALDLKGAYNLIRIKEGHEWKTAFRTKYGLFEYLVMPFGLTNAPAAFQRMINNVLREHLDIFVVCYLDDILIFSKTEEEHTEHVHKVLQTLQDAKLLVEPEKSKFHAPEVEFLGHIISHNEIRMDPKKVSAVKEWEEPTNVKEVQAFLGFANYYRKFLKAFGRIAAPLTELTKKDKTFVFGNKAKDAFDKIKELILSEPVLKMFDPSQPIELETDASDFALGAQIGQRDDKGLLHPIAFYSHKLHGAELNYPIYDKEFLAIVNAFKEFRHYLLGSQHQIKVYTDHKNITHFAKTQELSGRQLRYAEYLSEFDYVIIHVKGTENGRADAISRRPDLDTGRTKTKEQLLQNYNTTSYAKYTNTCYTDTKESIKP